MSSEPNHRRTFRERIVARGRVVRAVLPRYVLLGRVRFQVDEVLERFIRVFETGRLTLYKVGFRDSTGSNGVRIIVIPDGV